MAARFDRVPAALLGWRDPMAAIRVQRPTAPPLLAFNILLSWAVAR